MTSSAKGRATELESNRVFHALARSGYGVNGLLHILIGAIAIGIAVGARHQEADQSGALQQVASTPGGLIALWIAALGLAALAVWEILQVFTATGRGIQKKWVARVSAAGRAVVYGALCATFLVFAVGGSSSSTKASRSLSASILSAPGGVFLLVAIGLTVAGFGVYFAVIGIAARFTREIRVPRGSAAVATLAIGRVGYIAKGVVLAIAGVVFVVGAVTFDTSKTTGLDGALRTLAELPFGSVLLVVTAVGLMIYGLYLLLRARLQRL